MMRIACVTPASTVGSRKSPVSGPQRLPPQSTRAPLAHGVGDVVLDDGDLAGAREGAVVDVGVGAVRTNAQRAHGGDELLGERLERPTASTYTRSTDMHTCPLIMQPPQVAARAARSRSASASTIIGSLPPSSSSTGVSRAAARSITRRPVSGEPVTHTMSTWSTRAAPVAPAPMTTCSRSRGSTRFIASTARLTPSGASSDGFTTTALPARSAGMVSPRARLSGAFHGLMTPTTPRGLNTTRPRLPKSGSALTRSGRSHLGAPRTRNRVSMQMPISSPTTSTRALPVSRSSRSRTAARSRTSSRRARFTTLARSRTVRPRPSRLGTARPLDRRRHRAGVVDRQLFDDGAARRIAHGQPICPLRLHGCSAERHPYLRRES